VQPKPKTRGLIAVADGIYFYHMQVTHLDCAGSSAGCFPGQKAAFVDLLNLNKTPVTVTVTCSQVDWDTASQVLEQKQQTIKLGMVSLGPGLNNKQTATFYFTQPYNHSGTRCEVKKVPLQGKD
jgi:hypothetical protein